MFILKLFFVDKKWSFSKSSLRKYSGFNRTLIVKNFKFIAEFLDQTGGGKETIKDNLPWFDLFRMLKIQNLYLFKLLWYGTQTHVFYILSTYLASHKLVLFECWFLDDSGFLSV